MNTNDNNIVTADPGKAEVASTQPLEDAAATTKKKKRKPSGGGQRYTGYNVDKKKTARMERRKPWFWKILGISLVITMVILAGACFTLLHRDRQNTQAISDLNSANTMEALLKDHKNVTINCSHSNLAEETSYNTTRQVRIKSNGNYYSYLKVDGTGDDYKEVINDEELFRYDEKYARYYGLIGDDYNATCVKEIEESVFQGSTDDTVVDTKEREKVTTMRLTYEVREGDSYTKDYGLAAGAKVDKVIIFENDTKIVTSAEESVDDEVFYSYSVEFDKKNKKPAFYSRLQKKDTTRVCKVFSDYNGEQGKEYTYTIPTDCYFTLLPHKGYGVFLDEEATQEFSEFQVETQNPEGDLTLYVKAVSE